MALRTNEYKGTAEDIELLGSQFREKWLPRYLKTKEFQPIKDGRPYPYPFSVKDWLKWTLQAMGGDYRYCDPLAYSGPHSCDHHCSVTVINYNDFTVHSSAVMSFMYNNWEWAVGIGNYLLYYKGPDGGPQYIGSHYAQDQWRPRRFAAALLLPRQEVLDTLKVISRFNPAVLKPKNYEDYAKHFEVTVAGQFQVTSDPVLTRLKMIFKEIANQNEELRQGVTMA